MPQLAAKVVRIRHNVLFGQPQSRKIARTIEKWARKGYTLRTSEDVRGGCALFVPGYTLLTFIKDP